MTRKPPPSLFGQHLKCSPRRCQRFTVVQHIFCGAGLYYVVSARNVAGHSGLVVSDVVAEEKYLAIFAAVGPQVLFDVLDELVAVARDNELCCCKMVTLEDRLPHSGAVIMIYRVDRIIEND